MFSLSLMRIHLPTIQIHLETLFILRGEGGGVLTPRLGTMALHAAMPVSWYSQKCISVVAAPAKTAILKCFMTYILN